MLLTHCGWLRPDSCALQATRCAGDRVQACVLDPEATVDAREAVNRWTTEKTCADDPLLGPYTCGLVGGRATCVPETQPATDLDADAGSETETSSWIRVRVTHDADAGFALDQAERTELPAVPAPPDPAWGTVAVVSYRDGQPVDATLVPVEPDQADGHAWVADDHADEIRLIDADGRVLSTTSNIGSAPVSAERFVVPMRRTTNVIARVGRTQVQLQPRMLALLDQAIARVPGQLMLLAPRVVLELDPGTARTLAAGEVPSEDEPRVSEELPADFFTSRARRVRARWSSRGQELIVDLSSEALAEYETSTLALSSDIVRALAETYVYFTTVVGDLASSPTAEIFKKLPSDFPPELAPLLYNHYAQLLDSGESPVSAWHALHRVAAVVQLAKPYVKDLGSFPRSDEDAVRAGFASYEGASGPEEDLTDYIARAAVPESWTFGPCGALRGVPLDKLAPPRLVHASKLVALYGLGLLQHEALTACVGELHVSDSDGAFVVHKSDGEHIAFTEELEGIRQPYFSDEVQLSWRAQRAYLSASLSVGYRGTRPNVMRLQSVAGHEGRDFRSGADHGAVLAFTNPDGYRTSVAVGGLLVVTDVRPDALNAFALMAVLDQPIAGGKVFPLISAQVPNPTWGDAP